MAFVLAGGIGVLLGLVNALLVNRLRVPSIIITISTLNIFYGLLLWLSKGVWLYDFPPWFEKGIMLFKYTDADGYDYGLGLPLLTMIAVVLLTAFIMNFTTVGRKIYAMGGEPGIRQPRRLQCARPAAVRIWLYGADVRCRGCCAGVDGDDRRAGFTAGL